MCRRGRVVIGFMGRDKASNFEGYLSMGRTGGVLLLMGGAIGGQIGNGFVVGGAEQGAAVGMAGAAYGIACALTLVVVALFLNNFIYNNNYLSLADYTKKRYHNDIPGTIYDLSTAVSSIGLIAGQIMAGKALFEALGLSGTVGAIAISVVVLLYSQMSGLWGAFATSVVQTAVIAVGLITTTVVLVGHGAWGELQTAVAAGEIPSSSVDFSGMDYAGYAAMMLPLLFGMVTDQPTYQRISSAKSAKTSRIACYLSCIIMIPLALMPAFIGSYGSFKYGATGSSAFFDVILNELPAIVCALIIAAVLAAVMSTILALMSSSILGLLNSVYSFLAAACFVPFVGGIFWKRGNTAGAVAASVVGVAAVVIDWIPGVVYPLGSIIPAGLFPIIPSAVAYVIVSLCTKAPKAMEA